jgi:hypothetical protein
MCSLIENICEQIIADEQHTHKTERDSHSRPAKHMPTIRKHTKKYFLNYQITAGYISGKNFSFFEKEVLPRQKNLQINF